MKFMLALLAFGYVALASPSLPVHPGGIGGLFKGPNSETIIKGPDGSVITAVAEGGEVQSNLEPIVVAEPVLQDLAAPAVQTVAATSAIVEKEQSSELIGPSGRIATHGQSAVIAGPASTTVSGPAVLTQTVVKGPPVVATPGLRLSPPVLSPLTAVTGGPSIASISVTPAPLGHLNAELSPISVTASPLTVTSVSPLSIIGNTDLNRVSLETVVNPSLATVTATPTILSVTSAPPLSVASAFSSSHLSVASVSAVNGAAASASASPNRASAVVESAGGIYGVPLSINPSISVSESAQLPIIPSSTISPLHLGSYRLSGIDSRIDLSDQLILDQIALDNRQIHLNPTLIPSANIIPPEISVTPRIHNWRIRPTTGTTLTTPGLGTFATSTNIQREEIDGSTNVNPSTLQSTPQVSLTPQQAFALQNQQALLNNQIQSTHASVPVIRPEEGLSVTPNSLQINPQVNLDNLSADQVIALQHQQTILNNQNQQTILNNQYQQNLLNNQNQQNLLNNQNRQNILINQLQQNSLNNQIQHAQQAAGAEIVTPGIDSRDRALFTPNPSLTADNTISSLGNIPQNVLAAELAKSGIDPSQVRLTNIPLTDVSGLSQSGLNRIINDGLTDKAWGRYERNADNEKKSEKKVERKTSQ